MHAQQGGQPHMTPEGYARTGAAAEARGCTTLTSHGETTLPSQREALGTEIPN